jgi:iron complex transport system substrate-binding protein
MAACTKSLIVAVLLCAASLGMARGTVSAQIGKAHTRIVSLVPALTEILFAIGAGGQVIAVSSYDRDPPAVARLPKVGALLDPDTERILAMRPDLVLIYGSQDALRAQLTRAGIAFFDYRHAGLEDIAPVFQQLGELTGHVDEAQAHWAQIQARLDSIRVRVSGLARPRTLLVMGRAPRSLRNLDATGGVGFLHDMVTLAGGANVFADVHQQAVRASTEMLLGRAPEVVLDLHYALETPHPDAATERRVWDSLSAVPAVRQGRVYELFGDYLVVPGPRVAEAIEMFARSIHPEAYR